MKPEISMCWDGVTPTATLTVNGMTLTGHPDDVQEMFDELVTLREQSAWAEARVKALVDGMYRLLR